jgi:Asp-tRNA(Asn)/Glu-tRNA(Gln) amidotransferase A subunit family amidase
VTRTRNCKKAVSLPPSSIDITHAKDGEPEKWAGAPIGLQIVAQRLEEEKVVGMLCKIRDALEGRL